MRARVARLAVTSLVALGLIFGLWSAGRPGGTAAGVALGAGWALMPATLLLMLRAPKARYALVVPSLLITGGLLDIALAVGGLGWSMIAAGTCLGGLLGAWFWFGLLPVPRALQDPGGPGRWGLIVLHVGMIVVGMCLVGSSAF